MDGNEVVVTRLFNAPIQLVWEAWTRPEHIARWWGPKGFRTTSSEMEVRPGGVWRHVMHGPDGADYPNKIVFREVVPPTRLVYEHPGDEGEAVWFMATVTFADRGDKTEVTMKMVFESAEELRRIDKKYGAIKGADETMDRLGEYAASLA